MIGALADSLRFRLDLLHGMVRRDVLGRYRGSHFGLLWSLLSPLLMLVVYTFAFHELLGARWPGADSRAGFATRVFAGMIVHGLLAETLMRAPLAIASRGNFVKKVVFPLAVLPIVPVGAALFHAVLAMLVLIGVSFATGAGVQATALYLPLIAAPFVVLLCGLSWWLAALGVYVRDLSQLSGMIATMLLFLSPVFYPASALPPAYARWIAWNPLSFIIEQTRAALFLGQMPDLSGLCVYALLAGLFAASGLWVFRKLRRGFADVL
ncbi:ABC transporter permease [Arenimonas oryziterrae]|uniref:Transport permease protein n=1 Tax=Arenimonas oryziterrae DSM 21050 = YC6267 TaxID=1121015 RepID=A0A091ATD2_9GAMM|nr:ABC transporter permease [Arenimonas oryziterrae]KFN42621.1 hypothetical protein N789_13350 [Arenimonas oryziterrae DSM 21050 = YC6267]